MNDLNKLYLAIQQIEMLNFKTPEVVMVVPLLDYCRMNSCDLNMDNIYCLDSEGKLIQPEGTGISNDLNSLL